MIEKDTKNKKQLITAIIIYIAYILIVLIANILQNTASFSQNETLDNIAGILLGVVAIPIFSIILPLYFAKKWELTFSFWPKRKNILVIISILILYIVLVNYESIKILISSGISAGDFAIHYFSSMLFHVTYYPLFVVLMFPVFRKSMGLIGAVTLTSLAFSVYHLVQFYNFPEGLKPMMQLFLFLAFTVQILLYLWSESIILVSIAHSINGAVGLIAGGTLFNQIDFVFFLSIFIIISLITYMIYYEIRYRNKIQYDKTWWMDVKINKMKSL